MELILKTNNESNIAKIIALAKKLDIYVEQTSNVSTVKNERDALKKRILNFRANQPSSFGDATDWQRNERNDDELPFSK